MGKAKHPRSSSSRRAAPATPAPPPPSPPPPVPAASVDPKAVVTFPPPPPNSFIDDTHAGYYSNLLRRKVTESCFLDESKLHFPVAQLFSRSGLLPLLRLSYPYSKQFLYIFIANMEIAADRSWISSRVEGRDILLTREDFHIFLDLCLEGPSADDRATAANVDWSPVNQKLRELDCALFLSDKNTLDQEPDVVQTVLKRSVVPKKGDRGTISPHVSFATYFIVSGTRFDEVDLVISYLSRLLPLRRPDYVQQQNLALGSLLAFVVKGKYDLVTSLAVDGAPVPYSNGNFNTIWPSGSTVRTGKAPRIRPVAAPAADSGATPAGVSGTVPPASDFVPAPDPALAPNSLPFVSADDMERFFDDFDTPSSSAGHARPASSQVDTPLADTLRQIAATQQSIVATQQTLLASFATTRAEIGAMRTTVNRIDASFDDLMVMVTWMREHWPSQ